MIHTQLLDYLNVNKIIHPNQFGFQKNSGTLSAATNLIYNIYISMERKNVTATIFLDLRKAFDSVNHSRLKLKLESIGIGGGAFRLLESYLTNRFQFVEINGVRSSNLPINCGIPQGSIIGPTLFLIYINDIFQLKLCGNLQLFADDAAITYSAPDISSLKSFMENDLNILVPWLTNNFLTLNIEKTKFIIYKMKTNSSANYFDNIKAGKDRLCRAETIKYLGLLITSILDWSHHVESIRLKIIPMVAVLKRVAKFLPRNIALNVYFGYLQSHMIYLMPVWAASTSTRIQALEILQKQALKSIYGLPSRTLSYLLFSSKFLPLSKLILYEYMYYIYKLHSNSIKHNNLLQVNIDTTCRNTRASREYRLPSFQYSVTMKSVFYLGLKLFNALPYEIKCDKFSVFKQYVKDRLFEEYIKEYNLAHQI